MAATLFSSMGPTPFSNQCLDTADLDSWVDFGGQPSPPPAASSSSSSASSQVPLARASSSLSTSSSNTILPSDQSDDHQTPTKPSHEYDLYKQQTGLPSRSVPGLTPSGASGISAFSDSYSFGAGFDESAFLGTSSSVDDLGSFSSLDVAGDIPMDIDLTSSGSLPAFFYPAGNSSSQQDEFIDPSAIDSAPSLTPSTVRVWPGMHKQQAQQAALAKAQAQAEQQRKQRIAQQQQQQQQPQQSQQHQRRQSHAQGSALSKPRVGSHQPTDPHTEATIARVVNQIVKTQSSAAASGDDMSLDAGMLPHIVRMKKDEEDMDEDERLLASEEGKKLSSKERRQLRNKVSARAFRSRRKGEWRIHVYFKRMHDIDYFRRVYRPARRRNRDQDERVQRAPHAQPSSHG